MIATSELGRSNRERRRKVTAVAIGGVFYIAFLAFILTTAIDSTILSPDYYTEALNDNQVYDRVYTEVLADPQLRTLTQDLLGGSETDQSGGAIVVSLLRTVLPPETLKSITEQTVTAIIKYLNGDTKRIDTRVDLNAITANLKEVAGQRAANVLATAQDEHQDSIDAFDTLLQQFVTDLQSGAIPATIPTVDASSDTTKLVLDLLFGRDGLIPNPATRIQIQADFNAGDSRGALIVAAGGIQAGLATPSVTRLQDRLENGRYFDPLTALGRLVGQPEGTILNRFNGVRTYVEAFPSRLRYVALVVMLFCLGYVSSLAPPERHKRLQWSGTMLLVTGLMALVTFLVIARVVERQMENALSAGALSQAPPSVYTLVRDVEGTLRKELNRALLQPALLLALVGMVAVVAANAPLSVLRRVRGIAHLFFRTRRGQAVMATSILLIAGGVAYWWYSSEHAGPRLCNGHAELCRRRLDQVTLPATHNSMSSAADGWLFPDQEYGIPAQLNAGVRGLLIDTHYWEKNENDLQTATGAPIPGGLGGSIANLIGSLGTQIPGSLLCHTLCVLGAEPLTDGLSQIRQFMDDNRNEVLVIIIEDYISSADTAKAFQDSGLQKYVYTRRATGPWPTLGQMIRTNKRLVVFAENGGPPPVWYQNAYKTQVQDTSYSVTSPDAYTCDLNRGQPTASLLLLNHWIDRLSPDRADAATVNTVESITKQAALCQTQRHLRPNLVAVDFYSIGQLLEAVDKLNGVTSDN